MEHQNIQQNKENYEPSQPRDWEKIFASYSFNGRLKSVYTRRSKKKPKHYENKQHN